MEHKILALSQLDGHKDNYRQHPDEQIAQIGASLARFQQVRSIVVAPESNGRYTILAGHGVVEAARRNHVEQLACDIVPQEWDEVTRKAYIVADNNLSNSAVDDEEVLARLLQEQQNAGFDLAALGSDDETLRDLLAKMTPPTLDELAETFGDEPEEDAFWPVIRVKVSPETKELYESLMEDAEGTDESTKFAWVLERVNMAMEDEVEA